MKRLFLVAMLSSPIAFSQTAQTKMLNPNKLPESSQVASEGSDVSLFQGVLDQTLANKWYEKIKLKGYAHVRYNRLLETNNKLTNPQADRSLGDKQGFFLRRARLNFYGDVTDRMYMQVQVDYATSASPTGQNDNYLQIRDGYFDYHLDDAKEFRIRTGQSKVPYSFENLQSSSVRAPLDRTDSINQGVPNEYDMGVFAYWTPNELRQRFKELATPALKGSGDYGVIGFGVYNGQTLNRREANNDLHRVIRFAYPIKLANGQVIEPSMSAFEGKFNIAGKDYYDARQQVAFVMYPQPFGFQVEYNTGLGPEYDPAQDKVRVRNLRGGYILVNHNFYYKQHRILPYVRYQDYKGGKKLENGRFNKTREWEIGTEWQPNPTLKFTAGYAISDHLTEGLAAFNSTAPAARSHQKGNLLRLQAQFNY